MFPENGYAKDCGCTSGSLLDGLEMTGWLAPTRSKAFCCNCRSPRDGWEMAGWLALVISKNVMCNFRWLEDCRENTCCIRTPNKQNHQCNTKPNSTNRTPEPNGWVVGSCFFNRTSG